MKRNSKNFGFTLVEIMVVVSSIGIIMMITVGTILQTMKAQNRNEALSQLSDEGNRIIVELKRNVFNSNGKITCVSGSSVEVTNLFDNSTTVLSCSVTNNKIASTSGVIDRKLNSNDVSIVSGGCSNFAVCNNDLDTGSVTVTFNFGIGTSVSGIGSSRFFSTTVTVRN